MKIEIKFCQEIDRKKVDELSIAIAALLAEKCMVLTTITTSDGE